MNIRQIKDCGRKNNVHNAKQEKGNGLGTFWKETRYQEQLSKENDAVLQRGTTFMNQGPQHMIFSALEGRIQNYQLNFRESSKKATRFHLTNLFIACGLILLPSELFRIAISCKMFNSSMKFKFIHKISVIQPMIQEKFFVFFNLLRGLDITCSGAGGCASLLYWMVAVVYRLLKT